MTSATMLDGDQRFLDTAKEIAEAGASPGLQTVDYIKADIGSGVFHQQIWSSLLMYLRRLRPKRAPALALKLWAATTGTLLIVEPGTPQGFERINRVRSTLIKVGANIIAPCTHAGQCPMAMSDWCHFSVRLQRSREHMHAKGATVPFEDERYSYLAVSRKAVALDGSRILAPPQDNKAGLSFKLCTKEGVSVQSFCRRDKSRFRLVRKLGWGDLLSES